MTERFKNTIINHYILARYLLPIVLLFNTASLVLRYCFELEYAAHVAMGITVATFGFLILSPIVFFVISKDKTTQ
jgi:hypothetical protein